MNRITYLWLIITEAFEEIFYLTLVDPLRGFLSATGRKDLGTMGASRLAPRKPSEDKQGTLVAS